MRALLVATVALLACGGSPAPATSTRIENAPPPGQTVAEPEPPPPPPPGTRPPPGSTGIPECDAYIALLERLLTCDKMSAQARDSTRQSLQAFRDSFTTTTLGPDDRRAVGEACKQGHDAMVQSMDAMGCPH